MKNSKIHEGLENSNLRDFISLSIVKNYQQESDNKKVYVPYRSVVYVPYRSVDSITHSIKECENEISYYTKKLQILKERESIITIMKMQNWNEYDVCEETEKDLEYTMKMNFIGSEEEYNNFIKKLKDE